MEKFDLRMAQEICDDCFKVGRRLGQTAIVEMANDARKELEQPSKLRVVFVSTQLGGTAKALQEVFGIQALPAGMNAIKVKRAAKLSYIQKESGTAEEEKPLGESEDSEEAKPLAEPEFSEEIKPLAEPEFLEEIKPLAEPEFAEETKLLLEEARDPVSLTLACRASSLDQIDAKIIYSRNDFADFEWKRELAEADYVFLVTSAVMMLTAAERRFVEDCIQKYFGLARLSIVLSDTEMISNLDAYEDLQARMKWYLDSLGQESKFFELGTDELKPYILSSLVGEKEELHRLAAYQTAKICYEGTLAEVEEMQRQADGDLSALEACLQSLMNREETMHRKGILAANSIYGELMGNIMYNADQTIRKYFSQMHESICGTIDQEEDVQEMAKLIPRYMKTAQEQLGKELQAGMSSDLNELQERLETQMRQDAGEFFDGVPEYWWEAMTMKDPGWKPDFTVSVEIPEGETQARVNKVSKALLIGTIPVLIFGSLPLAIGTLVGSKAVKKLSQDKIEAENREALKQIVHGLCQDQSEDARNRVKETLKVSADQAEAKIRGAYDGFVSSVLNELVSQREKIRQACEKKDIIIQVAEQVLPEMKCKLERE